MGAQPHAETFILSSRDEDSRRRAVQELGRVGEFAAEMGASVVVVHGGHIAELSPFVRILRTLAQEGQRNSEAYGKAMDEFMHRRDAIAPKYFDALRRSVGEVVPVFEAVKVTVAIENMPTHHAIPVEHEMQQLFEEFPSPCFGYWHDFGHAAVKEQYGWIHHEGILRRMLPRLAGMHIHTNEAGAFEDQHLMPPHGVFAYGRMRLKIPEKLPRVLEPYPGTPADDVRAGLDFLRAHWK
jgi:sugar phosphate isomerase/epimerase